VPQEKGLTGTIDAVTLAMTSLCHQEVGKQ